MAEAPRRSRRRRWKRRTLPGAAPGTLALDPAAGPGRIAIVAYGPDRIEDHPGADIDAVAALVGRWPVVWISLEGVGDSTQIARLGEVLGLHRLALEDAVNVHQRPKAEDYDDRLFLVTRMPVPGPRFESEQVSIFLGPDFVLTIQERPGDVFDPVRERLRRSRGRIREAGPDYLAYALLDAAIDSYFPVLETYGEAIDALEDAVLAAPEPAQVTRIHAIKQDLLAVRRAVWPQREMMGALMRGLSPLVTEATRVYLRDGHDHVVQLIEMLESYRETASGLLDTYHSSVSARMNEVMKVLTIIATIFIPLGFIAGVYGMNFSSEASPWNMPELAWYWGYPSALALMAAVAAGLVGYFWRRGWLGRPRRPGGSDGPGQRAP